MNSSDSISIEFTNITLLDSNWKIHRFDVVVKNTNFSKSFMSIDTTKEDKRERTVIISKSTLGYLNISGYKILILECNIVDTNSLQRTLLEITNCNLSMVNCDFYDLWKTNSEPAILNAMKSHVKIVGMKCSENYVSNSLIQIQDTSQLCIEDSVFENNGYPVFSSAIVSAHFNSTVHISNCIFSNNHGLYGSCLYCNDNVTAIIENTSFSDNYALWGSTIFVQNSFHAIKGKNMSFSKINDTSIVKNVSFIDTKIFGSTIIIKNCGFVNSYLSFKGDTLYLQGSSIKAFVYRCKFNSTAAIFGGAIYAEGTSALTNHIVIKECDFYKCAGLFGGSIFANQILLSISNSKFRVGLALIEGTSIMATQGSIVDIRNCSFVESITYIGYIYIQQSVTLHIADSTFHNIPLNPSSYINSIDNCSVTINGSYFTSMVLSYTVAFNIQNFSTLIVTDSKFEANQGIVFQVLSAIQSTYITFTNCTFNKISGFMALHNTTVITNNSRITNCVTTLQVKGFIDISKSSTLNISNSNITDNKVLEAQNFINVHTNSSLVLWDISFSRNTMPSHLVASNGTNVTIRNGHFIDNSVLKGSQTALTGILVFDASMADVYSCNFTNNTVTVDDASMFSIRNSEVNFNRIMFDNNGYSGFAFSE